MVVEVMYMHVYVVGSIGDTSTPAQTPHLASPTPQREIIKVETVNR